MRCASIFVLALVLTAAPGRSPDIPFRPLMIDNGASETAAVADVNQDGRLDIVSGENWYEAARSGSGQGTSWTKHRFRELNFTSNYYDNFSDLPVDVDSDGYPDLVRVTWFAKKISWWKNPGRPSGKPRAAAPGIPDESSQEPPIPPGFNTDFPVLADMDNDGTANEV